MPRRKLTFRKGGLYHVCNYASHNTNIFELDEDCKFFIALAESLALEANVVVVAFALADSEYHLLVRQKGDTTMSDYMKDLGSLFARYYNRRHKQDGSIYKNRFGATEVKSRGYLYSVTRRLYLRAVRLRKCSHPSRWKYCNYREAVGETRSPLSVRREFDLLFESRRAFRRYVEENLSFRNLPIKDTLFAHGHRQRSVKNKEPPK